ncbi:MAG: metallophosphoesterase [Planctomycetes bacterium]|nr:metallophosphoesterase [Planctomycetota bacterium]
MKSTSARLAWRCKTSKPYDLQLVNLDAGSKESFHYKAKTQHVATMVGLTPGTGYRWSISFLRNAEAAITGEFTTLPKNPNRSFAVLGHTHGTEKFGHFPDTLFASTVEGSNPQFVVHTGDCVYHSTPANWNEHFFMVFQSILESAPIYIAPGNHDSGWPFIDGLDLRPFKELFPHDYPDESKNSTGSAYYDLVEGPIHFLFLSYVTELQVGSPQYRWISETLDSSTSAFKVVVLGGMNNYYDKQSLRSLLALKEVDAVLRGDGGAPKNIYSMPSNYPIFTVGSGGIGSPPWLYVTATPEHLTFLELNASGNPKRAHWIHSKRVRKEVTPLPQPTVTGDQVHRRFSFALPASVSSNKINGIQFIVEGVPANSITYSSKIRPKTRLGHGEVGFISQPGLLPKSGGVITIPIHSERPIRGGPYEINRISLELSGKPLGDQLRVTKVWLY